MSNVNGLFITAQSDETLQIALDMASNALLDIYGGCTVTITENRGLYLADDDTIHEESSYFVWAYGDENYQDELTALAARIAEFTGEESVLYVVNSDHRFLSQNEIIRQTEFSPRRLKVSETGDFYNTNPTPQIRLQGKWLLSAGIQPNSYVKVTSPAPGTLLLKSIPAD
jgi:hypothetical protein